MDSCIIQIPRSHMNAETVALTRCIQMIQVLNHRIMHAFSSKKNLEYNSLHNYRHSASQRQTFHSSLMKMHHVFKNTADELKRKDGLVAQGEKTPRTPVPHRNPNRSRIDGAIPHSTAFGGNLPSKTPDRHGALLRSGNASEEAMEMNRKCTGRLVQIHPTKADKKCFMCKANTSWYCLGCKLWFCNSRKMKRDALKELELYCHPVRGKKCNFVKTCFHKKHESAWERQDNVRAESNGE